ncbi:MAG: hypothetical protein E6J37_07045, partial [Chloroflexi bacterium]
PMRGSRARVPLIAGCRMAPDARQVPRFIQPGDLLRVDTRTGTYMERA